MFLLNEMIVKEYLEELGFFVLCPCKYVKIGAKRKPINFVNLIATKPGKSQNSVYDDKIWNRKHLAGISAAIVGIAGWHADRFYPATLFHEPELLSFAKPSVIKEVQSIIGDIPLAKIFCLSRLPVDSILKDKVINELTKAGVDGILTFETILAELSLLVNSKLNYEKSFILQFLRILKNYKLLNEAQLELFKIHSKKTKYL